LTDFAGKGCLIGCANAHTPGNAIEIETSRCGGRNLGLLIGSSFCAIFLDNADRVCELLSLGCRGTLPVADGMTLGEWSNYDGGRLVFHVAHIDEVDTGHESVLISIPDNRSILAITVVISVEFEFVAAWDTD